MTLTVARVVAVAGAMLALGGCSDRVFTATPEERVGYLRELVRARTVSRDSVPIDACSIDRFMLGVPAWRDSLLAVERGMIIDVAPCPAEIRPVTGRFVLTGWYRNWSGEYVIRGATYPWDQGYRFTDGIYVGREQMKNQEYFAGIAEPRSQAAIDSSMAALQRGDSIRRAGMLGDTMTDSARSKNPSR